MNPNKAMKIAKKMFYKSIVFVKLNTKPIYRVIYTWILVFFNASTLHTQKKSGTGKIYQKCKNVPEYSVCTLYSEYY